MVRNVKNLFPADTTPEALAVEYSVLSSRSGQDRAEMAFELSDNIRDITMAGIRASCPSYNESQLRRELIKRMHGVDIETLG
jgi:hypothetical protein